MAVSQSGKDDLIDRLAEEIAERFRKGERPSLQEYVERHPDLADDIREMLPALFELEQVKDDVAEQPASPGPRSAMPSSVGDYLILREIGRGGMGVVYEAQQLSLGRRVALKLLPQQMFRDTRQRLRFEREARAAARLHHTNIVPVFGVGEHDGQPYYSMQFIHGLGLDEIINELRRLKSGEAAEAAPNRPERSRVREDLSAAELARSMLTDGLASFAGEATVSAQAVARPCRPPEAAPALAPDPALAPSTAKLSDIFTLSSADGPAKPDLVCSTSSSRKTSYWHCVARIGQQVAEALDYAHRQGILHRDIKPSNLLLDLQGTAWVTDFGLAKAEGTDDLTHTGDLVGTLRYMAPERFQGTADARSDVYGLGLTLYEMLTLEPAFTDTSRARLIDRVTHEDPRRPRQADPSIPRDLETIVLKAITKEPDRRYQTAEALAGDLQRFLADRPIRARRASALERLWRWARRNPALSAAAGAAAALLLTVAAVASWDAWRLSGEQKATRRQLYTALVAQARASRRSRTAGQRFDTLAALDRATQLAHQLNLPQEDFLELRNELIGCLALPDMRVAKAWDGWLEGTSHINFDGKLQRYVRVDQQGNISVRAVSDDAELWHVSSGFGDCWPYLSPDGRFLHVRANSRCKVWELAGPEPRLILQEDKTHSVGALSPDSRQFALVRLDGSISLYDLPSGTLKRRLPAGPVPLDLAVSPDVRQLALGCRDRAVIRDMQTGAVRAEFRYPPELNPHVAWHPDSKTVAMIGGDRTVYLGDVATERQVVKIEGCKWGGLEFTFSYAGDLLAGNGWESTLHLWDPRTGQQLFQLRSTPIVASPCFSRDDRLLAADREGGQVRLWELAASRAYRTLVRDPVLGKGQYRNIDFSSKNRLMAASMADGVGLWDSRTGAFLKFVILDSLSPVLFERDSGALLTAGAGNVFRWPIHPDSATSGLLCVGPPERLPLPLSGDRNLACSPDGRVIASAQARGALVWHRDRPGDLVRLTEHEDARRVSVSPDGHWVATGSHWYTGAKVWDAATGRLEADLVPTKSQVGVFFSPDNKWLATTDGVCRVWAVNSWQEGFVHGPTTGAVAFSPDGRLLAVETGQNVVRLGDPETGREYARLEDPNHERATWIAFSPDGTQLVTVGEDQALHVWDLRLIRKELGQRGLDWELPPYPPEDRSAGDEPITVAVNMGTQGLAGTPEALRRAIDRSSAVLAFCPLHARCCFQRGLAHAELGEWPQARDDCDRALQLDPDLTPAYYLRGWTCERLGDHRQALTDFAAAAGREPHRTPALVELQSILHSEKRDANDDNTRAWTLVTGSDSQQIPGLAVLLAERAVLLAPDSKVYWNTLGVAQYRLGKWRSAIDTLRHSLDVSHRHVAAYDLYFLAMSYAKLGEHAKARACYEDANAWWKAHPRLTYAAELTAFRAEAGGLLGIPEGPVGKGK
jgi:serine/threonine protein kinase/WD40 repeat protein/tetratricopeptide (TPR) repeat protein